MCLFYPVLNDPVKYGANLAIDGGISTFFHPNTTSIDEWFQVDMGSSHSVTGVDIGFRSDYPLEIFASRRKGLEVRIGNMSAVEDPLGNDVCAKVHGSPDSFIVSLPCKAKADGRYIIIRSTNLEWWDLEEVNASALP